MIIIIGKFAISKGKTANSYLMTLVCPNSMMYAKLNEGETPIILLSTLHDRDQTMTINQNFEVLFYCCYF